ncbi:hypothetical protein [Devosia sp.]|nr:hypothetical protein [Devosia sp.]
MSDIEIRLACLNLAADICKGRNDEDVLALADRLYNFIVNGAAAPSPR